LDAKLSKKILKIAREQQEQLEKANEDEEERPKQFPLGFDPDEEDIDHDEEYEGDYEELEIDPADADLLDKFLPSAPVEKRTLADLIMEKINEKNAAEGRSAIGKCLGITTMFILI
jgi:essential nuclear protein 1